MGVKMRESSEMRRKNIETIHKKRQCVCAAIIGVCGSGQINQM